MCVWCVFVTHQDRYQFGMVQARHTNAERTTPPLSAQALSLLTGGYSFVYFFFVVLLLFMRGYSSCPPKKARDISAHLPVIQQDKKQQIINNFLINQFQIAYNNNHCCVTFKFAFTSKLPLKFDATWNNTKSLQRGSTYLMKSSGLQEQLKLETNNKTTMRGP